LLWETYALEPATRSRRAVAECMLASCFLERICFGLFVEGASTVNCVRLAETERVIFCLKERGFKERPAALARESESVQL